MAEHDRSDPGNGMRRFITDFRTGTDRRSAEDRRERAGERPSGGLRAPIFVAALCLFPVLFCTVNGFLGAGARAEARLPIVEARVADLKKEIIETDQPMRTKLEALRELGALQVEVEELPRTAGIHHAEGFRAIALLFWGLLGLSLLDMFVLNGRIGGALQWVILGVAAAIVVYYGVKGYFVEAEVRIGYSVYQVMAVLFAMITVTALDIFLFFGARSLGDVQWGKMPPRSQYVLVMLAVAFTFTIGLMGIVRSGIRADWHVYGVMRDASAHAYTPTMGYAITVVAVCSCVFFGMVYLIFRFGMRERDAAG